MTSRVRWTGLLCLGALLAPSAAAQEVRGRPPMDAARAEVCRLIQRTQLNHRHIRKGAIGKIVALRAPGSPEMTRAEQSYLKDLAKGLKEYEAHILAVELRGHQAMVKQRVRGKYRKKAGIWDMDQELTWFWIFQDGDWYRLVQRPVDWNEKQAVAVVLPAEWECPGK